MQTMVGCKAAMFPPQRVASFVGEIARAGRYSIHARSPRKVRFIGAWHGN